MADMSTFWSWWIIALSLGGLLFVFIVVLSQSFRRKAPEKVETMGHVWDEDLAEYNNPLPGWWLKLFYLTLAFALIYLVLYPGLGTFPGLLKWSQTGQYEQELSDAETRFGPIYDKYRNKDLIALAADPDARKIGERLFATYCTSCHGADARGGKGYPNLRDHDWLYGGAPETIKASIMNGRSGTMPAWGAVLGHEGAVTVAEYVLSLNGRQHNPLTAQAGKQKFDQICAGCHMPGGTGNQAIGAPNLANNTWLYGGSQQTIIDTIMHGRQGRMPAHGEFLGEAKVHLLAAYIYSLSHEEQARTQ